MEHMALVMIFIATAVLLLFGMVSIMDARDQKKASQEAFNALVRRLRENVSSLNALLPPLIEQMRVRTAELRSATFAPDSATRERYNTFAIALDTATAMYQAYQSALARLQLTPPTEALRHHDAKKPIPWSTADLLPHRRFSEEVRTGETSVSDLFWEASMHYDRCKHLAKDVIFLCEAFAADPRELIRSRLNLDAILRVADTENIPTHWIFTHPLLVQPEVVVEEFARLLLADPAQALKQLDEMSDQEQRIRKEMTRVVAAKRSVDAFERPPTALVHPEENPETDPHALFRAACQASEQLTTLIAKECSVDDIERQADKARNLFLRAETADENLRTLHATAQRDLYDARDALAEVETLHQAAITRHATLLHLHANLDASHRLASARYSIELMRKCVARVTAYQRGNEAAMPSSARVSIGNVGTFLHAAKEALSEAQDLMDACEADRRAYLRRIEALPRERAEIVACMVAMQGDPLDVADLPTPRTSGCANYGALLGELVELAATWEIALGKAEEAYRFRSNRRSFTATA